MERAGRYYSLALESVHPSLSTALKYTVNALVYLLPFAESPLMEPVNRAAKYFMLSNFMHK